MTVVPRLVDVSVSHAPVIAALQAETGPEAWSAEAIARIIELPGAFGFVIVAGDAEEPVGFILCQVAADEAEVLALGVRGAWRGRGYGGRLMEAALGRVAAAAVHRMFLEVAEDNGAARRLYERTGFVEVGRRAAYYRRRGTPPVDALILQQVMVADTVRTCG